MTRRRLLTTAGTCLVTLAVASADPSAQELALWTRDARQRPGDAQAGMLKLDKSATLPMRVGQTRALLPLVTGATGRTNLYLDICVPVDAFEVVASSGWPTVEVYQSDCVPYSTYVPAAGAGTEAAPREPLRFRALTAGIFRFEYKILAADGLRADGEFSVHVGP